MRETRGERYFAPVTWLNLVCLDAPLVALAWQALFAVTFRATLDWRPRATLFLTAWLIYLIDRFVDARSLAPNAPKSARQIFCLKHSHGWIGVIAVVITTDFLAIGQLETGMIKAGLIVGAAAAAYLAANALTSWWRAVPLKELSIGILFAAGTLLAPWVRLPHDGGIAIAALVTFATVCSLNCVCIAVWERELDETQQKQTIATKWPQLRGHVPLCCAGVAVLSGAMFAAFPTLAPVLACVAASALLLGLVDRLEMSRDARTALADLALLTPLIALPLLNGR